MNLESFKNWNILFLVGNLYEYNDFCGNVGTPTGFWDYGSVSFNRGHSLINYINCYNIDMCIVLPGYKFKKRISTILPEFYEV